MNRPMLSRLLDLIVAGIVAFFFVNAAIRAFAGVVEAALRDLVGMLGAVGGVIGQLLGALVASGFVIGLLVRGVRFVASRDPRVARERAARDRAVRQRVRRPAEGVPPVEGRAEVLYDTDPAIGEEG